MNKRQNPRGLSLLLTLFTLLALVGCNMPRGDSKLTPTINVTQAFQTVEARLTQAVTLTPGTNLSPIPTLGGTLPLPTPAASTTPTPPPTPTVAAPTTSACDMAAAGTPIDVTIPDGTEMQPGQTFTKTWRLQNVGTCAWTKDYTVALFSGDSLGAQTSVHLAGKVDPGKTVDISVDMVAPTKEGTYQGNWKLRNASNVWFGLGPGGTPFWVKIVVGNITGTPGTPTATSTESAEPTILSSGTKKLNPGDRLNLDSGQVNSNAGDDLAYDKNQNGKLYIAPISGASFGHLASGQPSYQKCLNLAKNTSSIQLINLQGGAVICYQTDQGLIGWLTSKGYDASTDVLRIQFLTWTQP
jgi:hypothetical protein